MENDARRGWFTIGHTIARHFLKDPIDCAHMKVHMLVQAGAEPVDEGDCADVQGSLVHTRRTRAMSLQALRNNAQKKCAAPC